MVFNGNYTGFRSEDYFVWKLNKKRFDELDFNFQIFIEDLFPNVKTNDYILCKKNEYPQKFDILVTINNLTKRFSLKKGYKNSVHSEGISSFIHFLIENDMPKELVIEFLKYHYADGTTNGKGLYRLSAEEYKLNHKEEIQKINNFINQPEILRKCIKRFITKGNNSNIEIDALVYGVIHDFIWIKREDIYNLLLNQKEESNSIHFGRLTYQPMDRCLNYNEKYENKRFISQIKWYNIGDDIIEYMYNESLKNRDKKDNNIEYINLNKIKENNNFNIIYM